MRRARLVSLLSLLVVLSGCQTQPLPASTLSHRHRLVAELALPRQVQASVSRNLVSMIDHYTANLLMWDGDSFEPLATPLSASTTELIQPKFAFDHLGPGRYQVRAVGYNASNAALTTEGSAEVDLTGNDVDLAPQVTVPLSMLPVEFSATLPMPSNATTPGSVPAWVTGLEAVVSVGGTEIARHSYTPGQAPLMKNLAAGVSYDVTVTASDGSGYSDDDSYSYAADPNAATLDDAPTHAFSWTAPPPAITTYTTGSRPSALAVGPDGNVWVANYLGASVTRFSTTGSKSTYTVGGLPSAIAVDPAGNVWVVNNGTDNVTRISATGSKSTLTVGTSPTDVGVDAAGNAWVTNEDSKNLTRISATGVIATYTMGDDPRHVAVDSAGNAWVANWSSPFASRVSSTGVLTTFNGGNIQSDIAVDAAGNAWVSNFLGNDVTRISSTGSISTFSAGTVPIAIIADSAGNAWVANRDSDNVTRISATGSVSTFTVGDRPMALAADTAGNVWVVDQDSDNVTRISSTGSISTYSVGDNPCAIAVDAAGNAWVANEDSNSVTKIRP